MGLFSEQRRAQAVAIAAFAAVGAAIYAFSPRSPRHESSAVPTSRPDSDNAQIEAYLPPHEAYSATKLDPYRQTDRAMAQADAKVRAAPNDPDPYVELSVVYMQKARETADAGYLLRAEASCTKAMELRQNFYDAMEVIPWIYGAQHRFDEAAAAARKAQAMIPADAWNYGTLGDALLELGDYDGAIKAYDRMADLSPDSAALARVARLRELLGNPAGAMEVMSDSVQASLSDHPEHYAWALTQRGTFHFNIGQLDLAAADYLAALDAFANYHLALAGLARVRAMQGKFAESETLYRKALDVAPYQETIVGLIDLLLYQHRDADTAGLVDLMSAIQKILEASHVRPGWLLVQFWADHDLKLPEALDLAKREAADRRDVKTMDALAWALYKNGIYDQAAAAGEQARRLGTQDALLYFHAGMIQNKLGNPRQAAVFLRRAMEINPYFDVRHAPETKALLSGLQR